MNKISKSRLLKLEGGGDYVTGPIINALVNVVKFFMEAGHDVGSSIRRISSNKMCPLD